MNLKDKFSLAVKLSFLSILIGGIMWSCKKDDPEQLSSRLFRPIIKGSLVSNGNWIKASWETIKEAKSYTVEISRDTFKTIDFTVEVDSNSLVVEDLIWNQLYQLQVKANAHDATRDSKAGTLGEIKTTKFPTILKAPNVNNIRSTSLIIEWENVGEAPTHLKVLKGVDSAVVLEVPLNASDISSQSKLIEGLQAQQPYIIYIYSNETVRGWDNYVTKAEITGDIIDLSHISGQPNILYDTLTSGNLTANTIILKRGETYSIPQSISLSQPISIVAEDTFDPKLPIISMAGNFNIVANGSVDYLHFTDVVLRGTDYSSKYVLNINAAGILGEVKFENCRIEIFRGITRTQNVAATINLFSVNNCIVDSIAGYGIVVNDGAASKINQISITNSTISGAEIIVGAGKNNAQAIKISDCTFYRAPNSGRYIVDYNGLTVTDGVLVSNCIFSTPKTSGTTNGVRVGTGGSMGENNYYTSDYTGSINGSTSIPGLKAYSGNAATLFNNPVQGDFSFKDVSFAGKGTAGDPRWR